MPDTREIAEETVDQLGALVPALQALPHADRALVTETIRRALHRQLHRDLWQVYNNEREDPREALFDLVDPSVFTTDLHGRPVEANRHAKHWREWTPGLDTDHLTLGEVMDGLPAFPAEDIPELIRLFENPSSPVALVGACTLEQHDAIHVLIGRGLLDQDEAFTIGFTAGSCNERLTEPMKQSYRIALASYREPYRVHGRDLLAFDLGAKAGRLSACRDLDELDVDALRHRTVGELRAELGIDVDVLRGFFRLEQAILPKTPASLRLPT